MPIYEYACSKCNEEFELLVRGSEQPTCPSCGGHKLDRLLSIPAAHTRTGSQSLPVCQANSGPPCGPDFCRTGQCNFD